MAGLTGVPGPGARGGLHLLLPHLLLLLPLTTTPCTLHLHHHLHLHTSTLLQVRGVAGPRLQYGAEPGQH